MNKIDLSCTCGMEIVSTNGVSVLVSKGNSGRPLFISVANNPSELVNMYCYEHHISLKYCEAEECKVRYVMES